MSQDPAKILAHYFAGCRHDNPEMRGELEHAVDLIVELAVKAVREEPERKRQKAAVAHARRVDRLLRPIALGQRSNDRARLILDTWPDLDGIRSLNMLSSITKLRGVEIEEVLPLLERYDVLKREYFLAEDEELVFPYWDDVENVWRDPDTAQPIPEDQLAYWWRLTEKAIDALKPEESPDV